MKRLSRRKSVTPRRFTQADLNAAFCRGWLLAWRAATHKQSRGRGAPKLGGEAAFERAQKRYGAIFAFLYIHMEKDANPRGAIGRALDAAAGKFNKDASVIERAWRKWDGLTPFGPSTLESSESEIVERFCTRSEIRSALVSDAESWTRLGWRKLVKLAKSRAQKFTAEKSPNRLQ